jgi:hypothetical protein
VIRPSTSLSDASRTVMLPRRLARPPGFQRDCATLNRIDALLSPSPSEPGAMLSWLICDSIMSLNVTNGHESMGHRVQMLQPPTQRLLPGGTIIVALLLFHFDPATPPGSGGLRGRYVQQLREVHTQWAPRRDREQESRVHSLFIRSIMGCTIRRFCERRYASTDRQLPMWLLLFANAVQ